ncbi:unnamed protein product [Linum tenue]|uniref:Uncharacterized protein n=1 Tax=Linum tenue TaxID=586396 RepID=A0AAV0L7X4_9ROSI|nr:unnamed protein product [Linum tenue]
MQSQAETAEREQGYPIVEHGKSMGTLVLVTKESAGVEVNLELNRCWVFPHIVGQRCLAEGLQETKLVKFWMLKCLVSKGSLGISSRQASSQNSARSNSINGLFRSFLTTCSHLRPAASRLFLPFHLLLPLFAGFGAPAIPRQRASYDGFTKHCISELRILPCDEEQEPLEYGTCKKWKSSRMTHPIENLFSILKKCDIQRLSGVSTSLMNYSVSSV